jgi:hypothetical protein
MAFPARSDPEPVLINSLGPSELNILHTSPKFSDLSDLHLQLLCVSWIFHFFYLRSCVQNAARPSLRPRRPRPCAARQTKLTRRVCHPICLLIIHADRFHGSLFHPRVIHYSLCSSHGHRVCLCEPGVQGRQYVYPTDTLLPLTPQTAKEVRRSSRRRP